VRRDVIDANVVIALLTAVTLLAGFAARTGTPYPVVLVLGGLVMGLVPGVPSPELDPDLVLLLFLPPLLYSSAFLSSVRELRANAGPILVLAIGLVLATTCAVAAVAVAVAGLPWAVAFVLGAVLGPTDPVSASAILQRLGAPERLVTILEGESLVNDGTAITAYAIAIAAVDTGHFSLLHGIGEFVYEVAVGTAIGLAAAWVLVRLRRRFDDPGAIMAATLLTPYAAYIPADALGASGVLAAVAAGLYAGAEAPELTPAGTRLQLRAFWELLVFLLNALLFLLIGMQLPHVLDGIGGGLSGALVWHALAIGATVIGLRLAWMLLPPAAAALRRGQGATPARTGARFVLGWSGMRGAVSLAIALAIPLTIRGGEEFPHRAVVIFLAYAGVLLTLVPAGFTLGPLIDRLGLGQGPGRRRRLAEARSSVLRAALEELERLADDGVVATDAAGRLRAVYEARLDRIASRLEHDGGSPGDPGPDAVRRAQRAIIGAQRRRLGELERDHRFPADLLREIHHDLDLEESRLR
jgi:CPA1 family monovalent cation:H+ antiporter